jgi:hypothetical protein
MVGQILTPSPAKYANSDLSDPTSPCFRFALETGEAATVAVAEAAEAEKVAKASKKAAAVEARIEARKVDKSEIEKSDK